MKATLSYILKPGPHRPFLTLLLCVVLLTILDGGQGRFLNLNTLRSALQTFATLAPIALGLGAAMLIREFDLSIAGLFGLAGCVAVLTGMDAPILSVLAAVLVGTVVGLIQGVVIVRLRLGSVGVTLGGLLICAGLALVISGNRIIGYDNMDVAILMGERMFGVFTLRSLIALGCVVLFAGAFHFLRYGRDAIAIGSNRQAAAATGVHVAAITIGIFALSGMMTALSGSLLSYSLASASPTGLSDVLVPATAAAILGGVSLGGGAGGPLGVAAGVMVLSVLRAGVNAIGAPPFVNDLTIGGVLLVVAIIDGPELARRLAELRKPFARPSSEPSIGS